VKVTNCTKGGPIGQTIRGIEWSVNDYKQRKKPSVMNLSLGASQSLLDDVVTEAIKAGIIVVAAAGNGNTDSCTVSPAKLSTVISVASSSAEDWEGKLEDVRSTFSNYGSCVTLFAPGSLIESDYIGPENDEVLVMSGTSMACPMVVGIVGVYLGQNGAKTPAQMKQALIDSSIKNLVQLNCNGNSKCSQTPNRMAYSPCA